MNHLTMSHEEILDNIEAFMGKLKHCEIVSKQVELREFCETLAYYTAYCIFYHGANADAARHAYLLTLTHHHIKFDDEEL